MTKKQMKLLRYLYKHPRSVAEVYQEFSINYDVFIDLAHDLTDYIDFDQQQPYQDSILRLSHQGEAAVESFYRELRKDTFHIIIEVLTLAIAVAAFIQGFFILPDSTAA